MPSIYNGLMRASLPLHASTHVPVRDKNECVRFAMQSESTHVLKTKALYKLVNNSLSSVFSDLNSKKRKKTLFINKKLAVNIDHVIGLLF